MEHMWVSSIRFLIPPVILEQPVVGRMSVSLSEPQHLAGRGPWELGHFSPSLRNTGAGVAESPRAWPVQGSNPSAGKRFFILYAVPDRPLGQRSLVFGVGGYWGTALTSDPQVALMLRMNGSYLSLSSPSVLWGDLYLCSMTLQIQLGKRARASHQLCYCH